MSEQKNQKQVGFKLFFPNRNQVSSFQKIEPCHLKRLPHSELTGCVKPADWLETQSVWSESLPQLEPISAEQT